jgi:hypothetical protein
MLIAVPNSSIQDKQAIGTNGFRTIGGFPIVVFGGNGSAGSSGEGGEL